MVRAWLSFVLVWGAFLGRTAPVAAAPTPIAQPTSKWIIEFEHERCTAARAYSGGTREFAIGFEPKPTSPVMNVIVQVPKALDVLAKWNAWYSIGAGRFVKDVVTATPSTKPGVSRYNLTIGRDEVEHLLQNPDLQIGTDQGPRVHVRLADFPEVIKTLNECEAGLLADWGLARETQGTLKSFPKTIAPEGVYFSSEDYPPKAYLRDAIGIVEARVTVNTHGRAVDCHIMQTSGHKDLDDATCAAFVKRARFEPARDKSGNALMSPYVFTVNWVSYL